MGQKDYNLNEYSKDWIGMSYTDGYIVNDDGMVQSDDGIIYVDNVAICTILNHYDKLLQQYKLQLERKDIIICSLRKHINASADLFNKTLNNVDDEDVKKVLLEMKSTPLDY